MSKEIREQIDALYAKLEEGALSGQFILIDNSKIFDEIDKLRLQCQHKFSNGLCIYCDKEEI